MIKKLNCERENWGGISYESLYTYGSLYFFLKLFSEIFLFFWFLRSLVKTSVKDELRSEIQHNQKVCSLFLNLLSKYFLAGNCSISIFYKDRPIDVILKVKGIEEKPLKEWTNYWLNILYTRPLAYGPQYSRLSNFIPTRSSSLVISTDGSIFKL